MLGRWTVSFKTNKVAHQLLRCFQWQNKFANDYEDREVNGQYHGSNSSTSGPCGVIRVLNRRLFLCFRDKKSHWVIIYTSRSSVPLGSVRSLVSISLRRGLFLIPNWKYEYVILIWPFSTKIFTPSEMFPHNYYSTLFNKYFKAVCLKLVG